MKIDATFFRKVGKFYHCSVPPIQKYSIYSKTKP